MVKLEIYEKNNNTFWTKDEINDLQKNYIYYSENKKEAEKHFKKKWSYIRTTIIKLINIIPNGNKKWTEEQVKELKEKYFYYINRKKEAENKFQKRWSIISAKAHLLKITSMKINKKCPLFLGCHVAERVLSHVFKNVERMPNGNIGYDFICNKGFKIDVKSSCITKNGYYSFKLNCNKIADYFLLIGFDNRENLNPQHIWLIKGNLVDEVKSLVITNSEQGLLQMTDYELTDKLKEIIECCNELKNFSSLLFSFIFFQIIPTFI